MAKNGLCESFDVDSEPPAHAAASKSSSHRASPVKQGTADGKSGKAVGSSTDAYLHALTSGARRSQGPEEGAEAVSGRGLSHP